MRTGETIFQSLLDKPLGQLTEEDISQLTREDCRKYLKEKGMRRPSWNKSQAIEQVISLKTLLEPDNTAARQFRHKIHVSRPDHPPHVSSNSPTVPLSSSGSDVQISASTNNEAGSCRHKDAAISDVSCRITDDNTDSPRNMSTMNQFVGQMTIFYCGKVNVYDGMPVDKARTIMQLAASPIPWEPDSPPIETAAVRSFAYTLQAAAIRPRPPSPSAAPSPIVQNAAAENFQQRREGGKLSVDIEPEGTSRKASLQRYLEKRKDRGRFKSKRKIGVASSSSLEIYANHQGRVQIPNDQSSPSSTCSPPQPRPPHTPIRCSSVENLDKNAGLSVDLNNNGLISKRFNPWSICCKHSFCQVLATQCARSLELMRRS